MSRSLVEVATPDDMHALGVALGSVLRAGDLLVLTGPLGAGKTTLTRGLGEGLGVRGPVTSPTFVIARTHPSLIGGPPLVHVDAYRVGSAMELDDLDIDFARSVVVAEWGEGMLDGVADSWLDAVIERPTGAGGVTRASDVGAEPDESAGPDASAEVDVSDEPVEARTVTFVPHGEAWIGRDLPGLAG